MAKVYLISCRDAGVDCDFQARGSSVDEVMQLCADHGIKEHSMKGFGPELYTKMRRCMQVLEEEASGSTNMIDWEIEGLAFGNCNCDWTCPCQFELRPSHGNCQGFEAVRIDRGHFGDVPLDGLKAGIFYAWPGAIFEGGGELQAVIDERADSSQREGLLAILYGRHTNEAATHWWVYHAMADTVHDPLFKSIEFEADLDGRTARVVIPELVESLGSPIRSPVTGDEHRVRIDLPNGIEFDVAEVGNASTQASGMITLNLENTYGQWNRIHQCGNGVVRS